jgi:F-type H+-transporting ATPase subunit b
MTLDWFTIAAQVINFLVLLYLLKRFLFPPIIRAMDKREELIASRLKDAEDKRREAEEARQSYEQKQQEAEGERQQVLAGAREDADKLRKELSGTARKEVENETKRWQDAMRQQQDEFLGELRQRTAQQVLAATRKTLDDLADEDLEHRIVSKFLERLGDAGSEEVKTINDHLKGSEETLIVSTAYKLSKKERDRIEEELNSRFQLQARPRFETTSDATAGIQLSVGDIRIAWTLKSYLDDVEREVLQALEGRRTGVKAKTSGEEADGQTESDA